MMRALAAANVLDVAKIEAEVNEILHPPKKAKEPKPAGPNVAVACTRCRTEGMSHDFVRAGADWFCRPCAKSP